MSDPAELALARKAISMGLTITGYCEWDDAQAVRVRGDSSLQGLTPEYIRDRLCEFSAQQGGELKQAQETRPEFSHRAYYYKAVLPEASFPHGLFVECELVDFDRNDPSVTIFDAHEQRK